MKYAAIILGGWFVIVATGLIPMRLRGMGKWLLEAGRGAHEHVESGNELTHIHDLTAKE